MVVCKVRPEKDDPDCSRITIGSNCICFPGDVGTNTASLKLVKLLLNRVLSCPSACFSFIDLKNFYLNTLMPTPNTPTLKLRTFRWNSSRSTTFKVMIMPSGSTLRFAKAVMAFPRPAFLPKISSNPAFLLKDITRRNPPQVWHHKWHPIQFSLIVDDFGAEYVGIEHFNHLRDVLKKFHGVQFNMAGNKFVGIDIKWDYATRRCCISIPGYIKNLLIKFKHPCQTKPCLALHKCLPIAYGAKA
jgi:hypothetical protein